jgi:hypothetical protein
MKICYRKNQKDINTKLRRILENPGDVFGETPNMFKLSW